MIEIGITYPGEPLYTDVSDFACAVYTHRLHARIANTPTYFAYARDQEDILGCVGITRAQADTPLLIETYAPGALTRLSGSARTSRRQFAELGTRAVRVARTSPVKSATVSLSITALALLTAHRAGVRYVGLTANRTARKIADELALPLSLLGEPDLEHMDATFRALWTEFFRVKQYCFGCALTTDAGCYRVLSTLTTQGALRTASELARRHVA